VEFAAVGEDAIHAGLGGFGYDPCGGLGGCRFSFRLPE
jgi:hypothetical protein